MSNRSRRTELIRTLRDGIAESICGRIEELHLTQNQAAEIVETGQAVISRISNHRFEGSGKNETTSWQLLEYLIGLGAQVEIKVSGFSSPGNGKVSFDAVDHSGN